MESKKNFLLTHLYVILGLIIVIILGTLYYFAEYKPSKTVPTVETIYDSSLDSTPISQPKTYIAHITGAVISPGVYEIEEGSRVNDLIELAGGLHEDADINRANLAAYVNDAQHIHIPFVNDESTYDNPVNPIININTATKEMLETLPGVGPVLAQSIINYREAHGMFSSIEDIRNVPRIGEALFEGIRGLITV